MISVAINQQQFTAAGLTFTAPSGGVAFLAVTSSDPNAKPSPVGISTDGTNLFFFPERSAAQRGILALLGLDN